MDPDPTIVIVTKAELLKALDTEVPSWRRMWYVRLSGGLVYPRAFLANDKIRVLRGQERNMKLLAHEYGHALGWEHPSLWSRDGLFDLMSTIPLRVTDVHGIIPRAKRWLNRKGIEWK